MYIIYLFFLVFSRLISFFSFLFPFEKKDIIILSKPNNLVMSRSKYLSLIMRNRGLPVFVLRQNKLNILFLTVLGKPKFTSCTQSFKNEFRMSYARGLRIYKPKLIIQFDDSSPYSIYIKELSSANLVNVAHGVTGLVEQFSVIDYNYYFIYGQSSIDALCKNKFITSGSTNLIKVGPVFCDFELDKKPLDKQFIKEHVEGHDWKYKLIYSSSYTGDIAIQNKIETSHKIIVEYCLNNPNVLVFVSLHPLEKIKDFWFNFLNIKNLVILPSYVSKKSISSYCDMHLTKLSNSIIDFGLLGLDSIIVRDDNYGEEYLSLSNYFKIASSSLELGSILLHYSNNESRLIDFLNYHCEYTDCNSVNRLIDSLEYIYINNNHESIVFKK